MEPVRVMMSRMLCVVLAVVAGWSGVAAAETWPDRPIKAVIPFSAGSATDIIPRAVFEQMAVELGEPIVVENRGAPRNDRRRNGRQGGARRLHDPRQFVGAPPSRPGSFPTCPTTRRTTSRP